MSTNQDDVFFSPNTTLNYEDDQGGDSGLEEYGTPMCVTPAGRISRIKSLSNLVTVSRNDLLMTPMSTDEVDSGNDEKFCTPLQANNQNAFFGMARMKSLSNLSTYEKEFGNTPIDLQRLKKEFEMNRFGMMKIKSLTSVRLEDNGGDEDVCLRQNPLSKQESDHRISYRNYGMDDPSSRPFSLRNSFHNGIYRKKAGIGDTKYIGNDESREEAKFNSLTKIRSLGTMPDVVSLQAAPLTPNVQLKNEKNSRKLTNGKLHHYENVIIKIQTPSVDNSAFRAPFERSFRTSYNQDMLSTKIKCSTPMRQSDGFIQLSDNILQRMTTGSSGETLPVTGDKRTRSSLHNLPTTPQPNEKFNRNPSSGSIQMSETGSLDRMKSAVERRKKVGLDTDNAPTVTCRVEGTRVNPETLIDEIINIKKLDQLEESAETSGLQLFIASDGTTSLGGQETKARMPQGAFRQVVMKNPR